MLLLFDFSDFDNWRKHSKFKVLDSTRHADKSIIQLKILLRIRRSEIHKIIAQTRHKTKPNKF